MEVNCPVCGMVSQDPEFCDHCNTDLAPPALLHVPHHCPLLPGDAKLSAEERAALGRPESSLLLAKGDQFCRVHWLPRADLGHWLPLLEERARFSLEVLPASQRLDDPQGLWVMVESSGRLAEPWKDAQSPNVESELKRLNRFMGALARALEALHAHELVWLNFDPAALEVVSPEGADELVLRITNLDLEVYPAGYCPERWRVKPALAAPEVCRGLASEIGPRTDVFHLALYCYYWLTRRLPGGFPGAGLESFGFHLPAPRIFTADLPIGLTSVVSRGLAVEPRDRYATPKTFAAALADAAEHILERAAFRGAVTWEIGSHTRTGRAKEALQGTNEDAVLVKTFAGPERALVAVADGITTCDVGSGALASSMSLRILDDMFVAPCDAEFFPTLISKATDQAARALLDWAVIGGHEAQLREGQDLMGTTLVAGWLQGNRLLVANIGDSRAYLVQARTIEQLTVDGDLGSGLLAAGSPPEQVRELGPVSKALRECIGGCHVSPSGELKPLPDCFPTISECPLLPGDILVLCTDGLVEEHVFLDPDTLLDIVRHHRDRSAQELADLLVERADAMQRLPSAAEPEGFGDNVSCVVVKVAAG